MQYSDQIEIVAVNDLVPPANLAYLFKYDSSYGSYPFEVTSGEDYMKIETPDGDQNIKMFSQKDPTQLPWKDLKVDVVLECTGIFRTKEMASSHIKAGAKKVVISAPAKDPETGTIVLGVNTDRIAEEVISNASCTTNCVSPALKVLEDELKVIEAVGITAHAYTASQTLQDGPVKKDFRDGRAAAVNMIPSSTGAANAVVKVLPSLQGKLSMSALRVPVITGSMVHLTLRVEKTKVTAEEINELFRKKAENEMQGILEYSTDPLVSSDIIGNPHSCIFDSKLTEVNGELIKIVLWYDNEWGYTNRLVESLMK